MIYAAERDAVVRKGKELDSAPVRAGKPGPNCHELVLEKDELVQVRES